MRNHTAFSHEEIERARRFHRPLYRVLLAETAIGLGVLAALGWAAPLGWTRELPWTTATFLLAVLTVAAGAAARLPFGVFRHRHEAAWGLTAQGWRGWAADRAKSLAVGAALTAAALVPLVGLLSFVAPVVLEPIFNRFRPLEDERLAAELRELSVRAGVPVRDVLVADASRRTNRHNAYVSGLGRTRRVVVWDTLLRDADPRRVALVVAHELGHRRRRHVALLTVLGMLGAAAFVVVLWALPLDVADPRRVPRILFLAAVLELATLPFGSALSRRLERTADRFSLELTGDRETYVQAFRELALANLSDLDPPRVLYLALFSHP
ncbi:MAG TPA: M48 family metalloprotease, partial [Gaiellaceae bacterium]